MFRLVVPYFVLISFESMSSAFLGPIPAKLTPPPGPPALDIDRGTLERRGESPILHMRLQLLVPYSPSPHQPVKSVLEVLYPVPFLGST